MDEPGRIRLEEGIEWAAKNGVRYLDIQLDTAANALTTFDDARAAALVASTIDLAHSLGLRMVAEGVETEVGYAELKRLGCDQAQELALVLGAQAVSRLAARLEKRHCLLITGRRRGHLEVLCV